MVVVESDYSVSSISEERLREREVSGISTKRDFQNFRRNYKKKPLHILVKGRGLEVTQIYIVEILWINLICLKLIREGYKKIKKKYRKFHNRGEGGQQGSFSTF